MSDKVKQPAVRFVGHTNDWEQRKAKDLCFISTGKSNTQDSIEDGTYPFYVRSPIVEKSNRYLFDEEAVLTVGDGVGTGKVFHYVNGKYDLHQRVYRMFGFTDDISAKFFYYFFSTHFYDRVMSMTAKTSVDSVRLEMIADMDIQYPKVREQKAISDFFDGLNNLITLHQRKYDKLVNVKKSLLDKMFPKKGAVVPDVRFAGFTDAWEQRKLETICSVSSGANTAHEEDGKYFNLTMGSVSEDGQIMYSLKTNETSRLLSKGQLIMPTRDVGKGLIIGRTAYVPEDNRFYAGNCLYILTVNGDLDSKFLSYFINSNYVRQQFARVVSGGGQKQITLTDVSELTISLPKSEEEQKQISAIFENLDTLITLHQRKLEKLENIKKAFLEKIFI